MNKKVPHNHLCTISDVILWRWHRAGYDDAQVVVAGRVMWRWRVSVRLVAVPVWRRSRPGGRRRCAAGV